MWGYSGGDVHWEETSRFIFIVGLLWEELYIGKKPVGSSSLWGDSGRSFTLGRNK